MGANYGLITGCIKTNHLVLVRLTQQRRTATGPLEDHILLECEELGCGSRLSIYEVAR